MGSGPVGVGRSRTAAKTVPGIAARSASVLESCVREQSAMSPAPTSTASPGGSVVVAVT